MPNLISTTLGGAGVGAGSWASGRLGRARRVRELAGGSSLPRLLRWYPQNGAGLSGRTGPPCAHTQELAGPKHDIA